MTGLGKAGERVLGWYRRQRSDAVLLSFPQCGCTWLQVLVGRAFQLHFGLPNHTDLTELAHLAEFDRRVPMVLVDHDAVERNQARYRHRRVVLLVRDPRDVMMSLYHQSNYAGTLAQFVNEPVGGFASLLASYDSWAAALDVPAALLVVRYEDLQARPEAELAQVLAFLGVAALPATVAAAVEYGWSANMRRVEQSGRFRDELRPDQIARLDGQMARSSALVFGYGP